jgi:hypothetical protein
MALPSKIPFRLPQTWSPHGSGGFSSRGPGRVPYVYGTHPGKVRGSALAQADRKSVV